MQQVWRNRWSMLGWFALVAVTLVTLVAAAEKKNNHTCQNIEVVFDQEEANFFIDEKAVLAQLKEDWEITDKKLSEIDLKKLENNLEKGKWIANAELFFDNQQTLQVFIVERQPVARIFTISGSSFYIDSTCTRLPLSGKFSARLPMFTNFPSSREKLSRPDSLLLFKAKNLAVAIGKDDFWKSQVAQIDITPNGFEMIPTIGNHLIMLGVDGNWQNKLDRLFSFYKQVWTKVGFEKYEKLDVRFERQVVATVRGAKSLVMDSSIAHTAYQEALAKVKRAPEQALLEETKDLKQKVNKINLEKEQQSRPEKAMPKAIMQKRAI